MRNNEEDNISTCSARPASRLLFDITDNAGLHVRHDSDLAEAAWMHSTDHCWRVILCSIEPGRNAHWLGPLQVFLEGVVHLTPHFPARRTIKIRTSSSHIA